MEYYRSFEASLFRRVLTRAPYEPERGSQNNPLDISPAGFCFLGIDIPWGLCYNVDKLSCRKARRRRSRLYVGV